MCHRAELVNRRSTCVSSACLVFGAVRSKLFVQCHTIQSDGSEKGGKWSSVQLGNDSDWKTIVRNTNDLDVEVDSPTMMVVYFDDKSHEVIWI